MTKESLIEMGLTEEQAVKVLEQLQSGFVSRNQLAEELKAAQKKAKAEMMELLTAKHNTSRILGLTEEEKKQKLRQEER